MPEIDGLVGDFSVGLDTVSTPITMSPNASPYMCNTVLGDGGQLEKRLGTEVVFEKTGVHTSYDMLPVETTLGFEYIVTKVNNHIDLLQLQDDDTYARVLRKYDVWDAPDARAYMVSTGELDQRVVIATGTNKVVQLRFTEASESVTSGTPSTSATFTGLLSNAGNTDALEPGFRGLSSSNALVYLDGELQSGVSFSWASGNLVVSGLNSYSDTVTVSLVKVTWNWFAEAVSYSGYRLYGTTTRINTTSANDTHTVVAVPQDLTYDMPPPVSGQYPYAVYKDSSTLFTHTTSPTTGDQYGFSDGTPFSTGQPAPSPYAISFGAISGSDPTTVGFSRVYPVPFNGGTGADYSNLAFEYIGDSANALTFNDWTASAVTSGHINYFRVDGDGIDLTTVLILSNTEVKDVGSGASANSDNQGTRTDGYYLSMPGVSRIAHYGLGYYPEHVGLVGRRVVLSGLRHLPHVAAFSELSTYSSVLDASFLAFQVSEYSASSVAAPFDIYVSPDGSNKIQAAVEWQGSVFLLGTENITEVEFQNGVVQGQSKNLKTLTRAGIVSPHAYTVTTAGVYYLSYSSVYRIRIEAGGLSTYFVSEEIGQQLRSKLEDIPREALALTSFMTYNQQEEVVYIGLPHKHDTDLTHSILYHDLRGFWSEWRALGGFQGYSACVARKNTRDERLLLAVCTARDSSRVPQGLTLLGYGASRYMDYIRTATGASVTDAPAVPEVTVTASYAQVSIDPAEQTDQPMFWEPIKLRECNDVEVTVNGEVLTYGDGYTKDAYGAIAFTTMLFDGDQVHIKPRRYNLDSVIGQGEWLVDEPSYVSPVLVYKDGVFQKYGIDYTMPTQGYQGSSVSLIGEAGNLEYGLAYPVYYQSASFNQERLSTLKRITHATLLFDNRKLNTRRDDGGWETPANCNIAMLYNDTNEGDVSADVYGYRELLFDISTFDSPSPAGQVPPFVRFREPIHGTGYSYSLLVYSLDEAAFSLCGFQVSGQRKGHSFNTVQE